MDKMKTTYDSSKHHMIGGDGPNSYVRNSGYQKQLLLSAGELMQELINEYLDTENTRSDSTFRIADFGCSVGSNAFLAVENIVAAVENRYKSKKRSPEFHIFFNDLIQNDFNTLFKNIPSFRKYFLAAAPRSFYNRLFPKESIHFAHCSTALHWISRIPDEVTERSSNAWNKGRVHYSGAGKEVKNAYSTQYDKDMNSFLNARGKEVVDGGLMALVLLGFPDDYFLSSDSSIGVAFDILGSSLDDMVKMGKVREEKVDSFNLPFYYPCPSEVKALIEANGMRDNKYWKETSFFVFLKRKA
ncbi:hypothetical protein ACS0TY_029108 [Phlomoides rotata]